MPVRFAWLSVALFIVWAGCSASGQDTTEPIPSQGTLEIGTPYELALCGPIAFVAGEVVWDFDNPDQNWPPDSRAWWDIFGVRTPSYPVPGVLTLSSDSKATWAVDVDGSQWAVAAMPAGSQVGGCL
jgi:hypothetical protein